MTDVNRGRMGRRLLALPLSALLLAAFAGAAQADFVSYGPNSSDYPYVYLEPGQTIDRSAHFSLIPDGVSHAVAGSSFTLQPVKASAAFTSICVPERGQLYS